MTKGENEMKKKVSVLLVLLLAVSLLAGCGGGTEAPAAVETITVSVLVETDQQNPQWFRDVEIPAGTNGFELLDAATDGEVDAEWYAEFRSHFVSSILGVAPDGQEFWGAFLWNDQSEAWEPLPYGADWFSVKDGHIMGWALAAYDPENPPLPQSTP